MEAHKLHPHDRRLTLEFILPAMVKAGMIQPADAELLIKNNIGSKEYPLSIIAKYGVKDRRAPSLPLSLDSMVEWLAGIAGKPYFDIDPLKMDIKSVTQLLPAAYARRLQVIPVKVEDGKIYIATSEPFALSWVQEVQTVTGKIVSIVVSSPVDIRYFLEEFFTVRTATQDFKKENPEKKEYGQVLELERMLGKSARNELGKNASAVIRIVDWLFQFASSERATDIHIEPKTGKGQVRFRIDGKMRVVYNFDPELMLPVVSRIKILADMAMDERRKPQDGRIRYKLTDGKEMEMRLSTIPVQHGEKLVVRIFDSTMGTKTFEDLGFADEDIDKWERLINLPHGLVLVTGPTGSGKSTTLHTSMRLIAKEDVNICTVEDPVEILNEDLNQMQVSHKAEISFGNAIRAFLRQDPDIIMVGEIRDTDAGKMAIQAALTGHLVLSTLHTNDAVSSITRLIDLEIPAHLITASLRGIMAQRLVRRLCDHCKEKVPTKKDAWSEVVGPHVEVPMPLHTFSPVGCRECKQSGYRGRMCVYEMVLVDRALKDIVRKNVTLEELMDVTKGKYTPLRVCGAQKITEGVTSIEEVLRVIY
ncbi:MAG: type II/IV secretion system protein [Deltaproteobacteria bacterium]|nr:type II/IV secretion system protein [Deltaproteobacteria bacterium]